MTRRPPDRRARQAGEPPLRHRRVDITREFTGHPIGRPLRPEDLDLDGPPLGSGGLDAPPAVGTAVWRREAASSGRRLAALGDDVPPTLRRERAGLEAKPDTENVAREAGTGTDGA